MKFKVAFITAVLLLLTVSLMAKSLPPWMEGLPHPWPYKTIKPLVSADIYMVDADSVPATFTEDLPLRFIVDSPIFDDEPPSESEGVPLYNSRWAGRPLVLWYFSDWETKTKTLASSTLSTAPNEMVVAPLKPTRQGALEVFLSRRMEFTDQEGQSRRVFANASTAQTAIVLDITPPTCGVEITIGEHKGTVWPIENPRDTYPPPKLADVYCEGSIFSMERGFEHSTIRGLELDRAMVLSDIAVYASVDDTLSFMNMLHDNYELDETTIKVGISDGADDEPSIVGPINAPIVLSEISIPSEPYIFLEAYDTSKNKQLLYIPLVVE